MRKSVWELCDVIIGGALRASREPWDRENILSRWGGFGLAAAALRFTPSLRMAVWKTGDRRVSASGVSEVFMIGGLGRGLRVDQDLWWL